MQSTAILSALVKNAQNGDEKAFSELYRLTVNSSYQTAHLYLANSADIEDALQNAYAKVAKNLHEIKEPEKFCGWVSSIVKNECINYIKKESKKPVPTLFVKSLPENYGGTKDTFSEEFIERDELRQKVNGVLDGLNLELRSCLILYYYEEYSIKDIASLLGVPEGTVKSRLHYGKKQFEKEFRKLQKKDPTLYGVSAIPFLVSFIALKASSAVAPSAVAETAVTLASAAGASAGAVGTSATGAVSASAGVASAGTAATAGAAIAGTSFAVKVAAVAVAGAIAVGGSTVAVKNAIENRDTLVTTYSTEITEEVTTAMIAVIPSETDVTTIIHTSVADSTSASAKRSTQPQSSSQATERKTTKPESTKAATTRITTTKKQTTTARATTTKPTTTAPTTTKPTTTKPTTTLPATTKKETTTVSETISVQSNYAASGGVLTEYTGSESSVIIPSSVDGNMITSIGAGAFLGNTDVKSVSIPSGVTQIGQEAFADCTSLTTVSVPATVEQIGMGAFYGCTSLSSIALPNGVTEIADEAFAECSSLSSITIPSSVTDISSDAFIGCDSLVISCEENSYAHTYAVENSIEYVLI